LGPRDEILELCQLRFQKFIFKMTFASKPRAHGQFAAPLSPAYEPPDGYSSLAALSDLAQRMRRPSEVPSPFAPRWCCVSDPFPSLWRFAPPPTVTNFAPQATVTEFEPRPAQEAQPPPSASPQPRPGEPDVERSRRYKKKRRGQNQWVYKSGD
jgi:hypothetical protein